MKNEIENIFKERFDGYETAPSEGLFSKIQAKREKKRRAIWIWSAAGICLLAALSVGIANYTSVDYISEQIATNTELDSPAEDFTNKKIETSVGSEEKSIPDEKYIETELTKQSIRIRDNSIKPNTLIIKQETRPTHKTTSTALQPNGEGMSQKERAKLFTQIIQQKGATNGEGKFFIRGTQQGNKNPFSNKNKKMKEDLPPKNKIEEIIKEATPSTPDNHSSIVAEASPNTENKANSSQLDTAASPSPLQTIRMRNKWLLEATAATGYAHRMLTGESDDISARNETENAQASYGFQLNAIYQFSSRWNAQVGMNYTKRRESFSQEVPEQNTYTDRTEIRERLVIHPVLGELIEQYEVQVTDTQSTAAYTNEYNNSFTSISIPLAVEYNLLTKGRWKINTKLGLDATLYKKANGLAIAENTVKEYNTIPYVKGNILSTKMGIGVAYRATKAISLIAYPQMTYQLSSGLTPNVGYEQRDYSIFSHFGIRIRL